MEKIYPDRETIVPATRPKKGELSQEQRELNRLISKVRITAEKAINLRGKFRACEEFFRDRPSRHSLIWGCVSGLVQFRWQRRLHFPTP